MLEVPDTTAEMAYGFLETSKRTVRNQQFISSTVGWQIQSYPQITGEI